MTTMVKWIVAGFSAIAFLLPAPALAQATVAVPQTIGYQGKLLKTDGTPVTGTVTFTFRIYDAASLGTKLWEEERESIAVSNGLYAVFLGAKSPESAQKLAGVFDGHDRWLEVQVNKDDPLSQRHKIGSVAYAITATNAQHADRAASASNADTVGGRAATSFAAASHSHAAAANCTQVNGPCGPDMYNQPTYLFLDRVSFACPTSAPLLSAFRFVRCHPDGSAVDSTKAPTADEGLLINATCCQIR